MRKVYYKVFRVRWSGSDGRREYDERNFFVEKTLREYQREIERRTDFSEDYRKTVDCVDRDWYVDPDSLRMFERLDTVVDEEKFPSWYIERSTNDPDVSQWDLEPLDGKVANVGFVKDNALEFLFAAKGISGKRAKIKA